MAAQPPGGGGGAGVPPGGPALSRHVAGHVFGPTRPSTDSPAICCVHHGCCQSSKQ
jgi:hypothetical protein